MLGPAAIGDGSVTLVKYASVLFGNKVGDLYTFLSARLHHELLCPYHLQRKQHEGVSYYAVQVIINVRTELLDRVVVG